MDDEEKKLKSLILEVDQELEKIEAHETIKRLELLRKKAMFYGSLCDGWASISYHEEFLRLTDELEKQKEINMEIHRQLEAEAKKSYIKPKRIN